MHSLLPRLSLIVALAATVSASADSSTLRQAEALLDEGAFFAAERLVEPLAREKKPDPVALWALSRVRAGQSRGEEAIALAERAIKLDPRQARFHAQLGSAIMVHLAQVQRLSHASWATRMRKSFEKALELDAHNPDALIGLSRYYQATPPAQGGDLTKAREFAERARAVAPLKGEMELGTTAFRRNDAAAALQHFEAAMKLDPGFVEAQVWCGHALTRLGRITHARDQFERAVALNPKSELAREALQAFERTQKISSANP